MYFYKHIINIETLLIELDQLEMEHHHKKHLASLIDSTIHHTVIDIILSKLNDQDKQIFLDKLETDPKDRQLLDFLTQRVETIEDDIKTAVSALQKELHEDIKEAKKQTQRLKKGANRK